MTLQFIFVSSQFSFIIYLNRIFLCFYRFYWFHRNMNRTNDSLTKRGGSYGYGKYAFALNRMKKGELVALAEGRHHWTIVVLMFSL